MIAEPQHPCLSLRKEPLPCTKAAWAWTQPAGPRTPALLSPVIVACAVGGTLETVVRVASTGKSAKDPDRARRARGAAGEGERSGTDLERGRRRMPHVLLWAGRPG